MDQKINPGLNRPGLENQKHLFDLRIRSVYLV